MAGSAAAAAPGLPRTYRVQRVDSPNPTIGGDFGIGFVNAGDLNGDGKDDILVGTDEHGGGPGQIFEISGADGAAIRTISAPDAGGTGTPSSFGSYVGKIADIASCPGGAAGQTCPNNPSGAPDGVPDLLVTALGVDVPFTRTDNSQPATLVDAGRAYVVDGATGAILKRLDMPASDLTEQLNAPGGAAKPAFGRTILSPAGLPPCAGNMGVGACPSTSAVPNAVRIGDINGGGEPDILVGASDYFETGATANPDSPCAAVSTNQCLQAGREYVYHGESIAGANGTDPTTTDSAPDQTIKNPTAQPDDPTSPVNANRESMGYSITPVGDLGHCTTNPGPGAQCTNANSSGTGDGKADYVLSSHRTDDFGMFDVGVAYVIDGATGSVMYTYHSPEPQPAEIFAFSNYNQPPFGDLGSSTTPDVYEPAMREDNPYAGGGKGFVMNGAFKQSGSPNSIAFAAITDPTPQASEDFGTSSAGVGNVVDVGSDTAANELLIGAYGPHNPGTNPDAINDIGFFSGLTEQPLQMIDAPDQQPGSGFGTALAPLGDLNGDGFLDFAVGAGLFDGAAGPNSGRIYVFRSDNSPAPPTPAPPSTGPAGTATVKAGRTLELVASRSTVRHGRRVKLSGDVEAFSNAAACQAKQPVQLQRRGLHVVHYRTFKRLTTSSTGDFSTRIKPTRSFVYRARVDETSQCLGAVSERERVTVTHK